MAKSSPTYLHQGSTRTKLVCPWVCLVFTLALVEWLPLQAAGLSVVPDYRWDGQNNDCKHDILCSLHSKFKRASSETGSPLAHGAIKAKLVDSRDGGGSSRGCLQAKPGPRSDTGKRKRRPWPYKEVVRKTFNLKHAQRDAGKLKMFNGILLNPNPKTPEEFKQTLIKMIGSERVQGAMRKVAKARAPEDQRKGMKKKKKKKNENENEKGGDDEWIDEVIAAIKDAGLVDIDWKKILGFFGLEIVGVDIGKLIEVFADIDWGAITDWFNPDWSQVLTFGWDFGTINWGGWFSQLWDFLG